MADQEIDQCDSSIFENKGGLAEDLKFLACMPELCDVTFLVGEAKEPVCAVKAILAARSRVFHKMFYSNQLFSSKKRPVSTGSTGDKSPKKFFSKRSSEPLLNNPKTEHASGQITITVEEFEPDVFRQFIEYIHTGCVTLQARTLLGLMNAADYYGLDELRRACSGFVHCCINVDTVCALLASAEKYIQYKSTKSLVQKALEFVDLHGDEVLTLASFTLLPQHVVRLVLSRDELRADELTKFHASLLWSQKYREKNTSVSLREAMEPFLEYIKFHRIPAARIMKDVHPTDSVPNHIIMNALAYQADPNSVDLSKLESPRRSRISRTSTLSLSGLRLRDSTGSTSTLNSSSSSDVLDNGRPSTDGGTSPIIYKREEVS